MRRFIGITLIIIGLGIVGYALGYKNEQVETKPNEVVPPLSLRFPPRMHSYALGDSLWVVGKDGEGFLIPHGSFLCTPDTSWDHTPAKPS